MSISRMIKKNRDSYFMTIMYYVNFDNLNDFKQVSPFEHPNLLYSNGEIERIRVNY